MKAVVDAGPIIALGRLGLLGLLHQLYDIVLVPAAVHAEVVARGLELGQPHAQAIQLAVARRELVVVQVSEADLSGDEQATALHVGERSVIHLARQEAADWLLLDDHLRKRTPNDSA